MEGHRRPAQQQAHVQAAHQLASNRTMRQPHKHTHSGKTEQHRRVEVQPSADPDCICDSAPLHARVRPCAADILRSLRSGSVLVKFGRRGAAASRAVRLHHHFGADHARGGGMGLGGGGECIQWASDSKTQQEASVHVADIVAVQPGQNTGTNFVRFRGNKVLGSADECFSIVYRPPFPSSASGKAPKNQAAHDAQLSLLRAGAFRDAQGHLARGLLTLDLRAQSAQEAALWVRGLNHLLSRHQEQLEEQVALKREGLPNPDAPEDPAQLLYHQQQQLLQAGAHAAGGQAIGYPAAIPFAQHPQPYQQRGMYQGEGGGPLGAEHYVDAVAMPFVPSHDHYAAPPAVAAGAYAPPAAFSPSATGMPQSPDSSQIDGARSPISSPHGSHAPAMFGTPLPHSPASPLAPVSPRSSKLLLPDISLPSPAACLVQMSEGIEFADAELEGDQNARVYTLDERSGNLLYTEDPSVGGSFAEAQARAGVHHVPLGGQRSIPVASLSDLALEDYVSPSGRYRGFLRASFTNEHGQRNHLHLSSENRFLLHLFHKGMTHKIAQLKGAGVQQQQQQQQQQQVQSPSPRHHQQQQPQAVLAHVASPAHAQLQRVPSPQQQPEIVDAVSLQPQQPLHQQVVLATPLHASPHSQQYQQQLPLQPPQPVPSSPHLPPRPPVSPSPRGAASPRSAAAAPLAAAGAGAAAEPPHPRVLPRDLDSLLVLALRPELAGLPDWEANMLLVSLVAQHSPEQNENMLDPRGILCSALVGSDHGRGLLALVLLELLYTSCESFRSTPRFARDSGWCKRHLVKPLPRWTRKPLESPHATGLMALFAPRLTEDQMSALQKTQKTRLALTRWNKAKMIISALVSNRNLGNHWAEQYHKLKEAMAYDHKDCFPVPVDEAPPPPPAAAQADPAPENAAAEAHEDLEAVAVVEAQHAAAAVASPHRVVSPAVSSNNVKKLKPFDLLQKDASFLTQQLDLMAETVTALMMSVEHQSPSSRSQQARADDDDRVSHGVAACESFLLSVQRALRRASNVPVGGRMDPPWLTEAHVDSLCRMHELLAEAVRTTHEFAEQRRNMAAQQQRPQQAVQGCFSPAEQQQIVERMHAEHRLIQSAQEQGLHADAYVAHGAPAPSAASIYPSMRLSHVAAAAVAEEEEHKEEKGPIEWHAHGFSPMALHQQQQQQQQAHAQYPSHALAPAAVPSPHFAVPAPFEHAASAPSPMHQPPTHWHLQQGQQQKHSAGEHSDSAVSSPLSSSAVPASAVQAIPVSAPVAVSPVSPYSHLQPPSASPMSPAAGRVDAYAADFFSRGLEESLDLDLGPAPVHPAYAEQVQPQDDESLSISEPVDLDPAATQSAAPQRKVQKSKAAPARTLVLG